LGFYDRLVDGLLEAGITPVPTLYHWDLPMVLQEEGGWVARSTAEAFASYAETVVSHLADRVDIWITINEPWVAAVLGHMEGIHAPGHSSVEDGVAASHHLLLAHGLATQRIRSVAGNAKVGIALNQDFMQPASMHPADLVAADLEDALMNRFFAEPLAGGRYPHEAIEHYRWDQAQVKAGDLQIISEPLDLIGLNYYKRQVVVAAGVEDSHRPPPIINPGPEFTEMGWEVSPTGMVPLIERLHIDNGFPSILITENGAAYPDHADGSGSVDDQDRISYLRRHLIEIHRAIELGLPVQGYLVWSLLDNFEWSLGYTKRFGLVRVDFQTQRRNPKASAGWYRDVVSANAITT
jgi:beta-glucosidase